MEIAMADSKLVLGLIGFVVFWVLAVFHHVPFLPVGRTAGSLLGATLMVIFQVISPDDAYSSIDVSVLGLLFGTMVVSVYLDRADGFRYLSRLLSWKSRGAKDLIFRVCLVSAITSACFTNDTACIVLTEFTLRLVRQNNLPPHPFLLALATSANIGSSATPIGNPQNLIIAINSGISFGTFLVGIFPSMMIGVLVNVALLLAIYWRQLRSQEDSEGGQPLIGNDTDGDTDVSNPAVCSSGQQWNSELDTEVQNLTLDDATESYPSQEWKRVAWKSCVYLVTIAMLIALVMGFNMSWTAITAAVVLIVLDFKDSQPCLDEVSYSLLIFFCGMFMTIAGFDETGIPSRIWDTVEPYAQINSAIGIALLGLVILVLSNLISNVPTVLLLGSRVAASAAGISPQYVQRAWLILAWMSTVSGNLTLVGSAANLIVCEKARRVPHLGYDLSFWSHLKFGVPSTIITTAIGLVLISH